jgi:hypothetical protein
MVEGGGGVDIGRGRFQGLRDLLRRSGRQIAVAGKRAVEEFQE